MIDDERVFQRARSAEHKEQRAAALLASARALALREGVGSVTLTEIAKSAGVHVSAVRRYFESREDIFLRLSAEGWTEWVDAVAAALATGQDLADVIGQTLAERPLFCDLLPHVQASFERQVSLESVWAFKLQAIAEAERLAGLVTAAVGGFDEDAGLDLVAAVTAMAGMLWQTAHPAPVLAALYEADPRLAHGVVDFAPRLTRFVRTFVRGLTSDRPAGRGAEADSPS
ncbi:MAG TPA: TetR family transcriptional regulator [Pseudonocardiaceae bacterium]|nr:TetR family transcriptional regulator [Pseudonocardiaceae bacterium]